MIDVPVMTAVAGWQHTDWALIVNRVTIGTFFAISGFHKLFVPARHAALVSTLKRLNIPFLSFNQWWVPGVEFAAGLALIAGLFTLPAAALLAGVCIVAACTEGPMKVAKFNPINKADVLDCYLYLPEVVYLIMLFVVMLAGPGQYSLDYHVVPAILGL